MLLQNILGAGKNRGIVGALVLVTAWTLAACGGSAATPTTALVLSAPTQVATAEGSGDAITASGSERLVELTKQNLVQKLAIAEDQIDLLGSVGQEWPDSSLGCPQPGMNYLQVVTPGFIIRYVAAGKNYEYHTDNKENYVLCNNTPAAAGTPGTTVK